MKARQNRLRAIGTILLCAFGTALFVAPGVSTAAPPPQGRTYFVVAVGIGEKYNTRAECFSFTASGVCSLDGEICGTWERLETEGQQSEFAFELFGLNEGRNVTMEGLARVDARGKLSAIGGAGRIRGLGPTANFAFSGRQTTVNKCVNLITEFEGDDQTVVEGSGDLSTESRDVEGFSRVAINGVGKLLIDQTGSESLTITAEDNILPQLRSDVVGDQLILGPVPDSSISTTKPIVYRLKVETLDELVVTGVTIVEVKGLDNNRFDLNLSGVSNVTVAGNVNTQELIITGTSIYRARNLASKRAIVDISGLGEAVLRVSESLSGTVSGFGRLDYLGSPVVDVAASGFGEVRKIGD